MITLRWTCLLVAAFAGCRPAPAVERYLVTERTIDVGVGTGLCIGVAPRDPAGVWWWEPGGTGCASRSTGAVFHPEDARVTPPAGNGVQQVSFRLGVHSLTRPFVDIRLEIDKGTLRVAGTTAAVRLVPRPNLEIPEMFGRGTGR